jgi:hypothetical protein
MSIPLTPADYFRPVLQSARLHNELPHDLNTDDLRLKVIENLRVNFLRHFQSSTVTDLPEPTSLSPSPENIATATSIITRLHERYEQLLNKPQVFDYYLEEEDRELADMFRRGEALQFMQETLAPYLADLAERGICSEEVLEEKYSEFLGLIPGTESIAAEDFWDSPAVMLYSSHVAYKRAVDELRLDGVNTPTQWFEESGNIKENQLPEYSDTRTTPENRPQF